MRVREQSVLKKEGDIFHGALLRGRRDRLTAISGEDGLSMTRIRKMAPVWQMEESATNVFHLQGLDLFAILIEWPARRTL